MAASPSAPTLVDAPVVALLTVSGDGFGAGVSQPILAGGLVVGRELDCGLRLPDLHVSRYHAQIVADGDRFRLEDLDSKGGTLLDGKRLSPHRPVPLRDGSEIGIGPYVLRFKQP